MVADDEDDVLDTLEMLLIEQIGQAVHIATQGRELSSLERMRVVERAADEFVRDFKITLNRIMKE